jgi:hypothetical protein
MSSLFSSETDTCQRTTSSVDLAWQGSHIDFVGPFMDKFFLIGGCTPQVG